MWRQVYLITKIVDHVFSLNVTTCLLRSSISPIFDKMAPKCINSGSLIRILTHCAFPKLPFCLFKSLAIKLEWMCFAVGRLATLELFGLGFPSVLLRIGHSEHQAGIVKEIVPLGRLRLVLSHNDYGRLCIPGFLTPFGLEYLSQCTCKRRLVTCCTLAFGRLHV